MDKQEFVKAVYDYIEYRNNITEIEKILNIEVTDCKLNAIADNYLKLVCKNSSVEFDYMISWIFESGCGKDKELCSIWDYGDKEPSYVLDTVEKIYDYFNVETKKPKTAKITKWQQFEECKDKEVLGEECAVCEWYVECPYIERCFYEIYDGD